MGITTVEDARYANNGPNSRKKEMLALAGTLLVMGMEHINHFFFRSPYGNVQEENEKKWRCYYWAAPNIRQQQWFLTALPRVS
jgi:hypothetical protein